MTTTSYRIDGMTCDHCSHAVTTALTGLDGVDTVAVDLATGTATIVASTTIDDGAVEAALVDAGYELAAR
jgi:copper chaperone